MKRWLETVFSALWMLVLSANFLAKTGHKLFGWPEVDSAVPLVENRALAPFPDLRREPFRDWGRGLSAWYDDHFARRPDVVRLFKALQFRVLKHPVAEQVPGVGDWVFRRSGNWPECEDYLGAKLLSADDLGDWRTLLEGRAEWAAAHGTRFLAVLTPVKAQTHPEKMTANLRRFRGTPVCGQLLAALRGSPAEPFVLALSPRAAEEVAAGREIFYHEDHHVNAYGCWTLYDGIVGRLRQLWFPDLPPPPPYFDDPPADVRAGLAPGCWTDGNGRLSVSVPGSRLCRYPPLRIDPFGRRYPMLPVFVEQPGERRFAVFGHDSFLRFPLSSWHRGTPETLALPVGPGFDRLAMMIFRRFDTALLDETVRTEIPDVVVEQFPESKLLLGPVGLDDTMRLAAAFAKARAAAGAAGADADGGADDGAPWLARAVFEDVAAPGAARLLGADGAVLAERPVKPGVRRAVYFPPLPARPARVELSVPCASADLSAFPEVRQAPRREPGLARGRGPVLDFPP